MTHRRMVFDLAMARKGRIRRIKELRNKRATILSAIGASPATTTTSSLQPRASETALLRLARGDATFALVLRCLAEVLARWLAHGDGAQTGVESRPALVPGVRRWIAGTCDATSFDRLLGKVRGWAAVKAVLAYEASGQVDSLRSLHNRHLGDGGAALVAAFIEGGGGITEGGGGITEGGGGIIEGGDASTAGKQNKTNFLSTLGMASNGIGQEGARALANALSSGSSRAMAVRSVEVYNNEPGEFWGSFAGTVLSRNPTLTNVDLGGNRIGDEGVRALVQLAGRRQDKVSLHLDYCGITDAGAKLLHEVGGGGGRMRAWTRALFW